MLSIIQNKIHLTIFLVSLWQIISVGLMATGVWSLEIAWVNFALILVLLVALPKIYAVGSFLLFLPFMVVLPNGVLADFPMWRLLVGWLFVVTAIKYLWEAKQTDETLIGFVKRIVFETYQQRLNPWDKWLVALIAIAILSLLAADFPAHGLKQIIFLINIYLLYLSSVLAINHNDDWQKLAIFLKYSLLITVGYGFIQYFATFTTEPYYFWQYWAMFVSATYYGQPLAEVLSYSNSWFSAEAVGSSLRMFGILQDTHAFAVIVLFAMAMWWAQARIEPLTTRVRHVLGDQGRWYFVGLTLLCFALIASGTRGVWVAMLFPMIATLILIYKYKARLLGALPLVSYTVIILLFLISPWITATFNWIRTVTVDDNILKRAISVYDLREASNVGRLEIWQESVKFTFSN
ncbi:MAG TPA: O-antigen ligase family protein, partial [Candidatus Doudnabacteria bacterium]|nr:O-antigen ligase family protein [Candidatus Doudnabacteria bacterium]